MDEMLISILANTQPNKCYS